MRKLALVLALTVFATPALAQTLSDLVEAHGGAISCWQRLYDAPHLASHPEQQVTEITFALSYEPPDESIAEEEGFYLFGMAASLRNGLAGTAGGGCWMDEGQMRCGVDCDGGGVVIKDRDDGKLLVDLEATGYVRMQSECSGGGESESFALEPGLDDKQFLLSPVAAKVCKALVPTW